MFKLSVHCVCSVWCVNHGGAVRVGACGMLQHVCGMCVYGLCLGMACPAVSYQQAEQSFGSGFSRWWQLGEHGET